MNNTTLQILRLHLTKIQSQLPSILLLRAAPLILKSSDKHPQSCRAVVNKDMTLKPLLSVLYAACWCSLMMAGASTGHTCWGQRPEVRETRSAKKPVILCSTPSPPSCPPQHDFIKATSVLSHKYSLFYFSDFVF